MSRKRLLLSKALVGTQIAFAAITIRADVSLARDRNGL